MGVKKNASALARPHSSSGSYWATLEPYQEPANHRVTSLKHDLALPQGRHEIVYQIKEGVEWHWDNNKLNMLGLIFVNAKFVRS
jgi:hypothetical protein